MTTKAQLETDLAAANEVIKEQTGEQEKLQETCDALQLELEESQKTALEATTAAETSEKECLELQTLLEKALDESSGSPAGPLTKAPQGGVSAFLKVGSQMYGVQLSACDPDTQTALLHTRAVGPKIAALLK